MQAVGACSRIIVILEILYFLWCCTRHTWFMGTSAESANLLALDWEDDVFPPI